MWVRELLAELTIGAPSSEDSYWPKNDMTRRRASVRFVA